jgi:hypothetical protein
MFSGALVLVTKKFKFICSYFQRASENFMEYSSGVEAKNNLIVFRLKA